jgi:hypothetical protein
MTMNVEQSVEWELAGETEISEKTSLNATLSTTNPAWPYLSSNPSRRATNCLSYGTAIMF